MTPDYRGRVAEAVRHFWAVRTRQHKKQRSGTGVKDAGNRGAVTGGKHLDGFIALFAGLLAEAGLPESTVHTKATSLPGYFRPTKRWDLVVVVDGRLLASIEFKAHVGSFGNNFNNRIEEALGSSMDLLTAYRDGRFRLSQRPWLGWLMLLEKSPRSLAPVEVAEPHFEVSPAFKEASYARRYELFCERLVRERLYDGSCLLMSNETEGLNGGYTEPNPEVGFTPFAASLIAHARTWGQLRGQ